MQIVIDIQDDVYKRTLVYKDVQLASNRANDLSELITAVANGIPLPKGHGRLIDADAKIEIQSGTHFEVIVGKTKIEKHSIDELIKASNSEVPTIIEADKEVDL